jgi:hypothetical protein
MVESRLPFLALVLTRKYYTYAKVKKFLRDYTLVKSAIGRIFFIFQSIFMMDNGVKIGAVGVLTKFCVY